MELIDIQECVATAMQLLFERDGDLLKNRVHERTVTSKLAGYLEPLLPEYKVDCDYNRHGLETKTLPRRCRGKDEIKVLPDVVVHRRLSDSDNLLVIEVKLKGSKGRSECDQVKLKEFTREGGPYHYQFGLFVRFDLLNEPRLTWYVSGDAL